MRKQSRIAAVALGLIVGLLLNIGVADAQGGPLGIRPPNTQPLGLTYGEWSAKWWQWAISIPRNQSPLLDTTGANCGLGQSGGVWFLAGNFGGATTRACTVPADKLIFIPVGNAAWIGEVGVPTDTPEEARRQAKLLMDLATNLQASIDGVPVQNLSGYRVQSPIFTVELPANNIIGLKKGVSGPSAAEGVFLMLAPLSVGKHTLHVHVEFPAFSAVIDVTYNLTIQ